MHALLKAILFAAALAAGAAGSADSQAAEVRGQRAFTAGDRLLLAQADCLSLDEAVERVRRQYNGRIVSAETRMRGNRAVHHIKVLTGDGKVKTVTIPGCTGGN